jgi:three-Cys-motif partner protein
MGQAKYVDADDGHSARVAPLWTEEKLGILAGYLQKFALACGKTPWYAIDAFAGGGLNFSESRKEVIPGSPLIALNAGPPEALGASAVVLAEKDDRGFKALAHRTQSYGERARMFRDANREIHQMLAEIPTWAPTFAFLDPEGSELDWETVSAIARHKEGQKYKAEQLILFSDTGVSRLADEYPAYVTRVFGHERWESIRDERKTGLLTADQSRTAYIQMYADGLKTELGYLYVDERQIEKPDRRPMYFLVFASDHPAGRNIMDNRFDKVRLNQQEELGQGALFDQPSAPRRRRLSDGDNG